MNPLDYVVPGGTLLAAEALLRFGADPLTSIDEATEGKQAPAIKLLLEAGTDCSKSFPRAVTTNSLKGAELCLQYGADPADAERLDKELADDPHCMYEGMSPKMRKLLDEWKAKRNVEAADTDPKAGAPIWKSAISEKTMELGTYSPPPRSNV